MYKSHLSMQLHYIYRLKLHSKLNLNDHGNTQSAHYHSALPCQTTHFRLSLHRDYYIHFLSI